ncbi:hypothetical protein DMENIID0001_088930 [Sergentomyia squamirostris]
MLRNIVAIWGVFFLSGITQVTSQRPQGLPNYNNYNNQKDNKDKNHINRNDHNKNANFYYPTSNVHIYRPPNDEINDINYDYPDFGYPSHHQDFNDHQNFNDHQGFNDHNQYKEHQHHESTEKEDLSFGSFGSLGSLISSSFGSSDKYGWLFKLAVFAIVKFFFKMIILKKILKFFSLIFLFFFIPAFIGGLSKNMQHFRKFTGDLDPKKLKKEEMDDLTNFVLTSIEGFRSTTGCKKDKDEWACRVNGMLNKVDSKYPIRRVLDHWKDEFGLNLKNTKEILIPTKVEFS